MQINYLHQGGAGAVKMIVKGGQTQWAEGLWVFHPFLPHRGKRQLLISVSRPSQAEQKFPIYIYTHGMGKAGHKGINKSSRTVPL